MCIVFARCLSLYAYRRSCFGGRAIEKFSRRLLPHWDQDGAIYFVTTCLQGSIPSQGLHDLGRYRDSLNTRSVPSGLTRQAWEVKKWKLMFARTEQWLDRESVVRHLANDELASEVEKSLLHFAGERYTLWAWVIMPSHLHWLFEPSPDWIRTLGESEHLTPRARVMQSMKGFTARRYNQLLDRSGHFWQQESYDHCVRDLDELQRIIEYIEQNPVKAGLVTNPAEFRFSSARYRLEHEIPYGRPLIGNSEL